MKRKQKFKLTEIIRRGCQLAGAYFQQGQQVHHEQECHGCVIANLIMATTPPESPLRDELMDERDSPVESIPKAAEHLCKEFGLTHQQLQKLQSANDLIRGDTVTATEQRRKNVLQYVEQITLKDDEEPS